MNLDISNGLRQTSSEAVKTTELNFGVVEWIIFALYMLVIIGLSVFFAIKKRQEKNRKNIFFQPTQKVPSWVLALSMWSTILTTITFLATPVNAYHFGWVFAFSQLTLVFIAPFVVKYLVPFFRIIKTSSAYGYLESRFNFSIRTISSILFIIFNIFRIGITLFLAINAISIIIPLDIHALIIIVGIVAIILTLSGGMTGIVYSDAIQALIRIAGVIIIIIYALANTSADKIGNAPILSLDSVKITLINASIWVIFISNLIISTYSYVGSQDVVRRYKSISDPRKIRSSIAISAILGTVSLFIFFGLGSALYSYYNGVPAKEINPNVIKYNTQLIPYFIFTVLPGALGAFILGSILTSAQVNISSGISSTANSIIVDFVQRLKPNTSHQKVLWLTKLFIVVSGILSIGVAIIFVYLNHEDLITIFLLIVGFFGASPTAVILLGMFSKRVSSKAALIGLIVGFVGGIPFVVISQKEIVGTQYIFSLWSMIISFVLTLGIGYLLSFICPNKKDITNLCWKSIDHKFRKFITLEKKIYAWRIFTKKPKVTEIEIEEYLELKKEIMGTPSHE